MRHLLPFLMVLSAAGQESDRLDHLTRELARLPVLVPSAQTHQRIGFHAEAEHEVIVTLDLERVVRPERVVLFPARLPLEVDRPSGFPSAFTLEIAEHADFADAVRLATWQEPALGAGEHLPFLSIPGNGASGRHLRLRLTGLRPDPARPGGRYVRLGEIVVLADGLNVALQSTVTSSASTESARRWERINLVDGHLWCVPLRGEAGSPAAGYLSATSTEAVVADRFWVEVDLGQPHAIDQVHLVPAHPRDFADSAGFGFPTHFRILADAGSAQESAVLTELEPFFPAEALPNPGDALVMTATPGLVAQRIRVTAQALWRRGPGSGRGPSDHVLALAELQVWQGRTNLAAWRPVTASSVAAVDGWSPEALTDGHDSRSRLLEWESWIAGLERAAALQDEAAGLRAARAATEERRQRQALTAALAAVALIAVLALVAIAIIRRRAMRAQAALRARIARDLHDELGAGLSHVAMQSDLACRQLAGGDTSSARLEGIAASARDLIDHMRDVVWLLAPGTDSNWDDLLRRLHAIAARLLDGVAHTVTTAGQPPAATVPIAVAREVVLILKEALTNARRHSRAGHITVGLGWDGGLDLSVHDDGCGFDQHHVGGGHGLDNLRRRAESIGGRLTIEAAPGSGTRVHLHVPWGGR